MRIHLHKYAGAELYFCPNNLVDVGVALWSCPTADGRLQLGQTEEG